MTHSTLNDESFLNLCRLLTIHAAQLDATSQWPSGQLRLLAETGVPAWFVPREFGGGGWGEVDLLRAYIALARSCLTTTFIMTQRQAAVSRIVASENDVVRVELLPALVSGDTFATVGISHLTTSHRHQGRRALLAEEIDDGFLLNGQSPWVTGGSHAQHVVLGATLADGRELLAAVPTNLPGIQFPPFQQLTALSASHTGPMICENVLLDRRWLLAGPVEGVMKQGAGTRTGGLQTSALALGLAAAAIEYLQHETTLRTQLVPPTDSLHGDFAQLERDLLDLASGCGSASADDVRARANSLALRSTQAALGAAKGAGFVAGHPAGRWCREALFFLVWSCPQNVLATNLCELAGLA